jgi:hypothetical protein
MHSSPQKLLTSFEYIQSIQSNAEIAIFEIINEPSTRTIKYMTGKEVTLKGYKLLDDSTKVELIVNIFQIRARTVKLIN